MIIEMFDDEIDKPDFRVEIKGYGVVFAKDLNKEIRKAFKECWGERMKVYEYFKDIWRGGFYTVSTEKGYFSFPTKIEAKDFIKEMI